MAADKNDKKTVKKETSSMKRLEASIYFLQWTKSILQAYTRTINELYLKKLVEHCTRSKIDDNDSKSGEKEEAEKLAAGPKVEEKSENFSIRERLKEAAVRMTQWEGDAVTEQKKVCVAEIAAMCRLTQLVRLSGTLLDILERTHKWCDNHFKLIRRHAISLDLAEYVLAMFHGTRCVAEVFQLTSVDLSQCNQQHSDFLGKTETEYNSKKDRELTIGEPKKYIPLLETQINHYRTLVHLLSNSMISIIQIILRSVPQEQINVRVRELKEALDQLPPMYLKVESMKLTRLAENLTKEPPPNRRSYALAPKDGNSTATRSGKSAARSGKKKRSKSSRRSARSSQRQQKSNVTKSKFKNPLSKSSTSSSKKTSDKEKKSGQRSSRGSED